MKNPAEMTSDEIHDELCALCDDNTDDARMTALRQEQNRRRVLDRAAAVYRPAGEKGVWRTHASPLAAPCKVYSRSSAVCSLGTKGCGLYHGR